MSVSVSDWESLRAEAATALESAFAFIEKHGDELARLRTQVFLQAAPPGQAVDAVAAGQRADGSFPGSGPLLAEALGYETPVSLAPPEVTGTLFALGALADLKALHHPAVEGAVSFLAARQAEDGGWGTAPDDEDRIFLTGMLGGFLGRTRIVRPAVLDGAGRFLEAHWSPERIEGGRWSRITAFTHFFTNVHHELSDEALQWCGRELERGFRTGRFEAVAVARTLIDCDAAALPGFGVPPDELLAALLRQQGGDGGFAELAAGGPTARVAPSLDAVVAILALSAAL
ncbi:MAG: terpene cyclase/mutase family protein [Proteobacteria bacterium]|nr:terpene cyclase/mutase family protein [Pseudomonadota bacterium]